MELGCIVMAAGSASRGHQLREKPGGEQAGIPPLAVVPQGGDVPGVGGKEVYKPQEGVLSEIGLVGHLEENAVTGAQGAEAQFDGLTLAPLRVAVIEHLKSPLPGQVRYPLILRDHHHGGEPLSGQSV